MVKMQEYYDYQPSCYWPAPQYDTYHGSTMYYTSQDCQAYYYEDQQPDPYVGTSCYGDLATIWTG